MIPRFTATVGSLRGTASLFIADPWMYLSRRLYWVGLNLLLGYFVKTNPGTPSDSVRLCRMSALKKDVDFLPMVKPDAINYSEIRRN